jgi:hypothetical protein
MTNYPQQPAPKRGMPGWLIALLVIFIVIAVGCCGGFATCSYFAREAVNSVGPAIEKAAKEERERLEKMQREAETRAADGLPGATDDTGSTVGRPATLPSDIPFFAGGEVDPASDESTTVFRTSATADTVATFYDRDMVRNGWTRESRRPAGRATMMVFKKEERTVRFIITPDPTIGKTAVTINHSK